MRTILLRDQIPSLTFVVARIKNYQIKHLVAYGVLGLWSLFTGFAILWIVMASFKSNQQVFRDVWSLPTQLHVENYQRAWSQIRLGDYFVNSVFLVVGSVILLLVVSAPASYALSRVKFRGNRLLTMIFIAGIGIPLPLLFIPLFSLMSRLSLVDSLPGLSIVYVSVSIPFTVYILTGFFATLPVELEEAAIVDGCTSWGVFARVMLPLASPGLVTAAIFNFIGMWNEFQLALIFINDPDKRPLSLGLYSLRNSMQFTGDWVGLFSGVVLVMLPTIVVFIFLSDQVVSGITMGAVK